MAKCLSHHRHQAGDIKQTLLPLKTKLKKLLAWSFQSQIQVLVINFNQHQSDTNSAQTSKILAQKYSSKMLSYSVKWHQIHLVTNQKLCTQLEDTWPRLTGDLIMTSFVLSA